MAETEKITYQIHLDFDQIAQWRDSEKDDLPVYGMISFYRASGVADFIKQHAEEFGNQVAALDIITCNFPTQQRIKKFISEQWEKYSLSLKDNNKVVWNTTTYPKGVEHYHRKPSKKVVKSLTFDFINYCPSINDELEDNIIELTVPEIKTISTIETA